MQSKAATVAAYLASLPDDRRRAIAAVRDVILANLDKDYEEGMTYGMIGYYVPHRVYPAGYHCDPSQPLPFAGLASQKGHMSLYLMGLYAPSADRERFIADWTKTGRKLDMGKACIRFKKIEEVALDVLGATIKRIPAKTYIARCEAAMVAAPAKGRPASKTTPKAPTKPKPAVGKAGPRTPAAEKKKAGGRTGGT